MRLTIIPSDNSVLVNGQHETVDCSLYPEVDGLHAVQWYGTEGHLEYINPARADPADYQHNTPIDSIEPYQALIDAWQVEHDKPSPVPAPKLLAHGVNDR